MTQNGSLGELTMKQVALLNAMLEGDSTEKAAKKVGIAERTAYRWVKEKVYIDALAAGRQALFMEHLSMLRTGIKLSLDTLARNMDAKIPPAVQVQAARCWLDNATSLYRTDAETTQINLLMSPEWLTLRAKLITALAPHAEARAAVAAALSEVDGGGNAHSN